MVLAVQVIECLRTNKDQLSNKCHAVVFKREVGLVSRFFLCL